MSSGTRSVNPLVAEQLHRKLPADPSRVFDCGRLHAAEVKVGVTLERFMFQKPNVNRMIYIKEVFTDDTMAGDVGWPVGPKRYFSCNENDAYQVRH